jgi:plasmid stability protein
MGSARRTTVYLEPEIHQALRLKAASVERSISEMVNNALRQSLAEDAADLEDFENRRAEKSVPFEDFVKGLRRRGKL